MVPIKISVILSLYRGERFLRDYLENFKLQSIAGSAELSIVHNDPTPGERKIIEEFSSKIRIIRCEVSRENLYTSWNRAIAQSNGQYIACWNVDDRRTLDSLEAMACKLDGDPSLGWTYGDFIITNKTNSSEGTYVVAPEWSKETATTGAIGGPFFMWRRNISNGAKWFDEQFLSGGDFDFTVRLSLCSKGARTRGLLGCFLNERLGLSTAGDRQPIERTVIQLRYGIFDNLDCNYIPAALRYRVCHILEPENVWAPLEFRIESYEELIKSRKYRIWKAPFFSIKMALRRWLIRCLRLK